MPNCFLTVNVQLAFAVLYATHANFVSHFTKLMSNEVSMLHYNNMRFLTKNKDKLEDIISIIYPHVQNHQVL